MKNMTVKIATLLIMISMVSSVHCAALEVGGDGNALFLQETRINIDALEELSQRNGDTKIDPFARSVNSREFGKLVKKGQRFTDVKALRIEKDVVFFRFITGMPVQECNEFLSVFLSYSCENKVFDFTKIAGIGLINPENFDEAFVRLQYKDNSQKTMPFKQVFAKDEAAIMDFAKTWGLTDENGEISEAKVRKFMDWAARGKRLAEIHSKSMGVIVAIAGLACAYKVASEQCAIQ